MRPRNAILAFLTAAAILALSIETFNFRNFAQAASFLTERAGAAEAADCTLGSCPRHVSIRENGRVLTYGIGTVITPAAELGNVALSCSPQNVFEKRVNAFVGNPAISFAAKRRGTCAMSNENFTAELRVSRFR